MAVPFLVVAVRPHRAAPAIWTLWIACASVLVAALLSLEPQLLVLLLWFVVGTGTLALPSVGYSGSVPQTWAVAGIGWGLAVAWWAWWSTSPSRHDG